MDRRFWAIIGVLILAFCGVLFANGQNTKTEVAGTTSHVRGSSTSKVTLVEYGDFQCNACSKFYPVLDQIAAKYADRVKFQFRNLPLTSIHPNAFAGARAAEAASNQGKFWEMHDLLYKNQDPYGQTGWVASQNVLNEYFVGYAKELKLDITKFKTDFASAAVNKRINADIDAFTATKQKMSTPSYFLNGKYIDNSTLLDAQGTPNAAAFSKLIDQALAKQ